MNITNIPAIYPVAGASFAQEWQWVLMDGTPVDLSDWSGEAVFSRNLIGLLTVPVGTSADGTVSLALTAANVGLIVGPGVSIQINLAAAGMPPSEVWRGQAVVQ